MVDVQFVVCVPLTTALMALRPYLIINADDFGYCKERNRGIIQLLEEGAVSSASILANAAESEEATCFARQFIYVHDDDSQLSFGLHLNLTEGHPIAKGENVSSLLDERGCFLGKFGFRNFLNQGKILIEEVCKC